MAETSQKRTTSVQKKMFLDISELFIIPVVEN
jgi:hypothetical protein